MERGREEEDGRDSTEERDAGNGEKRTSEDDQERGKRGSEESSSDKESSDEETNPDDGSASGDEDGEGDDGEGKDEKDSPGKREPTEEEKEKQREEDARAAQERLEEVMDAPPEEHGALKADALGSTIILIGALFVIFGLIVALAFSPWGWLGVAVGVVEVIVGQLIRSRGTSGRD